MRKPVVCFLIMSLILSSCYIAALASGPNPGWIIRRAAGIHYATIGTLDFATYVSANYRNDTGNPNRNEYYSYHWARVEGDPGTKFRIEFKHDPIAAPADARRSVNPSGVYEYDRTHDTDDVPPNTTKNPYTALRPVPVNQGGGGGSGELKSAISILIPAAN